MLKDTRSHFLNGDVRFLTFKGSKPRHQTVGFVNDLCRKVSSTYMIVRESNKIKEGFHFHALMKLNQVPKKNWYIKGVHMDLRRVGKSLSTSTIYTLTKKEVLEYSGLAPEKSQDLMSTYIEDKIDRKINVTIKRDSDVDRVIDYMSKELPTKPMQYADYVCVLQGRTRACQEGETGSSV